MKKSAQQPQTAQVTWRQTRQTLTLTGEPVMELELSWPDVSGKKMSGVSRYYRRLSGAWQRHWQRDGYWSACAQMAEMRARSRPFLPWKVGLSGEVTFQDAVYCSIAMRAREVRSDGRTLEYRWGDTWRQEDGSAVCLSACVPAERRWRKVLMQRTEQAAQQAGEQGLFLRESWREELKKHFSASRFALEEGGLILYYPQCTLSPAAEGAVELHIPAVQA